MGLWRKVKGVTQEYLKLSPDEKEIREVVKLTLKHKRRLIRIKRETAALERINQGRALTPKELSRSRELQEILDEHRRQIRMLVKRSEAIRKRGEEQRKRGEEQRKRAEQLEMRYSLWKEKSESLTPDKPGYVEQKEKLDAEYQAIVLELEKMDAEYGKP
jgi:hypothetical protein